MDLGEMRSRLTVLTAEMGGHETRMRDQSIDQDERDRHGRLFNQTRAEYDDLRARLDRADRQLEAIERAGANPGGQFGGDDAGTNRGGFDPGRPSTSTTMLGDDGLERAYDRYLRSGQAGPELDRLRAQSVGTDTAGGYTVPTIMLNKITETMKAFGGLASVAESIDTNSGAPVEWPTINDTTNEGEIVAEGAAGSNGADLVFGTRTLGAYRYAAPGGDNGGADPLRLSVELLQDSAFDVAAMVSRKLGQRLARAQASDWVVGTGTNEPEGIIQSSGPSATFAGTAPTYDELVDAKHAVDPDYRTDAHWVFNDTTMSIVTKMVDGSGRPLWQNQRDSGLANAPAGTLLGHPIVVDQGFADFTDASSNVWGVFGNIGAGYIVRRVREVQLIVDPYTRAAFGQVCYFAWARADGAIQDPSAFTLLANDAA